LPSRFLIVGGLYSVTALRTNNEEGPDRSGTSTVSRCKWPLPYLTISRLGAGFLELSLCQEDELTSVQLASMLEPSCLPDKVAELVRLQPFVVGPRSPIPTPLGRGVLGADFFRFRTIKIEGVLMLWCSPGAPVALADGQGASDRW